ncbi:Uncharacterised protein [Mycobacterium tuberculosis]|nr:Uncharacterised protein [Mycobacterium tuberculosis]
MSAASTLTRSRLERNSYSLASCSARTRLFSTLSTSTSPTDTPLP